MTRDEILNIVHNMPESPGVYQYFNEEGTIIYVVKASAENTSLTQADQKSETHRGPFG